MRLKGKTAEAGVIIVTDYISREDLLDLYSLEGLTDEEQFYGVPYAVIRQTILDMPAADVVEVVRCEDCKYWAERDDCIIGHCKAHADDFMPDFYCAWGKRRGEGECTE